MNKLSRIVVGVLAVIVLILGYGKFTITPTPEGITVAGVPIGSDYQSTTTSSVMNTAAANLSYLLLACGPGTLGNVIINDVTTGSFNLYDGTTTRSHTMHATTTLGKATASMAEGTYEHDSHFTNGLILEFPSSSIASSTITFRGGDVSICR